MEPEKLGRHFSYEGIRDLVAELLKRSALNQVQMAKALKVTPSAISQAARVAGPKWINLQKRIIQQEKRDWILEDKFSIRLAPRVTIPAKNTN